jgi:DnaK suppressor protein
MTRAEQKNYQRLLELRQAELIRTLRKRESLRLAAGADLLEQVQSIPHHDVALQHKVRQWNVLRDVNRALKRIENNTFGVCLSCEVEIPARRLAAVPWTRFCIECQVAAETRASESLSEHNFLQPRAA